MEAVLIMQNLVDIWYKMTEKCRSSARKFVAYWHPLRALLMAVARTKGFCFYFAVNFVGFFCSLMFFPSF